MRQRGQESGVSGATLSSEQVHLDLTQHLGVHFDNASLSDVTLVWSDGRGAQRRVCCHKIVLASMSTYFNTLFTGGMQESSQSEVVLVDVNPELCECMLRMLYGQRQEVTPEGPPRVA